MTTMPDGRGVDSTEGPQEQVVVRLERVSAKAVRLAEQHDDAMFREIDLVVLGSPQGFDSPADFERLSRLSVEIREIVALFRPFAELGLGEVLESGADEVVTSEVEVPRSIGPAAKRASEVMDEMEAMFDGSPMLVQRPPPVATGFRRWFLGQFADQIAGLPAVPWDIWWAEHGDGSQVSDTDGPGSRSPA